MEGEADRPSKAAGYSDFESAESGAARTASGLPRKPEWLPPSSRLPSGGNIWPQIASDGQTHYCSALGMVAVAKVHFMMSWVGTSLLHRTATW